MEVGDSVPRHLGRVRDVATHGWAHRAAEVALAAAGLAQLVRTHRSAQAADRALTVEHLTRLRRASADVIQTSRAHLAVERGAGMVHLSLSGRGGSGSALVDPAFLPVADARADAVRVHGVLESTLHADCVLAELRRVSRTGGRVEVDVGNAAAARGALSRGDLIDVVTRARAARGEGELSGRRLLRHQDTGSISLDVPITHRELLDLARGAGIEPVPEDVRPPLHRIIGRRIRLRGLATVSRGRPLQPWWPPLVRSEIPFEYLGPRPEVAALVPDGACHVLDLGCAAGSLGSLLESRRMQVTGIELDPTLSRLAERVLTKVVTGDIVDVLKAGDGLDLGGYDVVIAADCLEHLADPAAAVELAVSRLTPQGCMIVSVPNVRHWDTLWNLGVRGVWPQRPSGVHDRTHLRWFTRRGVVELLENAGLDVEAMQSVRRVRESHVSWLDYPARLLPGAAGELVTFQWLARARVRG